MYFLEIFHHRAKHGITCRIGQHAVPLQPGLERFALDIVHDDISRFVFKEGFPHTDNGRNAVHTRHLARFLQEIIVCTQTARLRCTGTVPVQRAFALSAHGRAGRIVFFDGDFAFQRKVKADVSNAEAAPPQHIADKIFSVQDALAGQSLRRLGVLRRIKAAEGAKVPI